MNASELSNQHKITSIIELKDGRTLYTTHNGFTKWVSSKKGNIDLITEAQYNKAKTHRVTKKKR